VEYSLVAVVEELMLLEVYQVEVVDLAVVEMVVALDLTQEMLELLIQVVEVV